MNEKAIQFVKNFGYSIASNLVALLVSTLVVLIVPRLIGLEAYGFWQLYLFYASYIGFLQFGWNDGIYLRYGGHDYNTLDKKLFNSQFWMLFTSQVLISTAIVLFTQHVYVIQKSFVFTMVGVSLIMVGTRAMLLFLLQATNRIKRFAQITMLDRLLYFVLVIVFLLAGVRDYKLLILADITSSVVSLSFAMYLCRDIVFRKIHITKQSFLEAFDNMSIGIKLMFANIASMLIIGVVRFGIEKYWDVATFGKISLTLSISNLTMLFINAIGIIMFPLLRKTDKSKLANFYVIMRDFLMVISLGFLVIYYPFKSIMTAWLPNYADSLMYMALVFPMVVYEGKMALLINTYLKTLRKEKLMLRINLVTVSLSIVFTLLATLVLKSLDLAILSIIFLLAFRSILGEFFLSRFLKIKVRNDILLELLLTIIFMLSGWFINSWLTVLVYSTAYVIYLIIKRKNIVQSITSLKSLMSVH